MNELNEKQKRVCNEIADFFENIPTEKIDQTKGIVITECGMCVGAWIAHYFNKKNNNFPYLSNYHAGKHHLAKTLDMSVYDLNEILSYHADVDYAFGTSTWINHPKNIFRRLSQ